MVYDRKRGRNGGGGGGGSGNVGWDGGQCGRRGEEVRGRAKDKEEGGGRGERKLFD
jgi:hypothetical protein